MEVEDIQASDTVTVEVLDANKLGTSTSLGAVSFRLCDAPPGLKWHALESLDEKKHGQGEVRVELVVQRPDLLLS